MGLWDQIKDDAVDTTHLFKLLLTAENNPKIAEQNWLLGERAKISTY